MGGHGLHALFGSLLLLGGRLSDLFGRKVTFLVGLLGFAGVSAIGGASVNFAMLVTARACQGAFAAILVPSALSLLTTTFTEPKDRGRAFGVYGAIAAAGGAVGLLLGGALTEYLSWRWTLYINLFSPAWPSSAARCCWSGTRPGQAAARYPGRAAGLQRPVLPGVRVLERGHAQLDTPSTYGFLIAGVALLAVFAFWQTRAPNPLLPPRVVLDRNRGGAYLSMLIASAAMFGTFLFLTTTCSRPSATRRSSPASPSCRSSAASRSRPTCPPSCSCPGSGPSRWSRRGC